MKKHSIEGIYQSGLKYYTPNPKNCKNIKVYGENLRKFNGKQYRYWNPYRSKLAAVLSKKEIRLPLQNSSTILYLGAATGTTVSHLSDICSNGLIYAVESSPVAASTLLTLVKQRNNIIPIIEDANHPERYSHMITTVDYIYQDISQRNQADIFSRNVKMYLKENGEGIMMVKARSIDVGLKPTKAFTMAEQQLIKENIKVTDIIELSPYEKDHAALLITLTK